MTPDTRSLGAIYAGDGATRFLVWAPYARDVELVVGGGDRRVRMQPSADGYFSVEAKASPGERYSFALDGGGALPDPASRSQPDGVHGPSAVADPSFPWSDDGWRGLPLRQYVIYELHVGTYTPEGTFDAVIPHLSELRELGITAIELMPIAQFPGDRNWGYDGVFPFAAQNSYGGVDGLRRLVDACHAQGLAVVLDVVYNHLGPEGNYTGQFGPYTTDRYHTPWGRAINFSEAESDHVRRFFIESALWWVRDCRIDALRVDAVHAIVDPTAVPFTQELCSAVHECASKAGRAQHVIAESSLNDPRLLRPSTAGGMGFDGVWNDDFHHALHVALTGERDGYYSDFDGARDLAAAYGDGFVYQGRYSLFRRRRHGAPLRGIERERLVVFAQNHDQVGNRADGARLSQLVDGDRLGLAAAAVLLSPNTPLLFMGEEYGETAPFQYFVSHSDPALIEAVRRGRREEFASFDWQGEVPDPQAVETFERSKLDHRLKREAPHAAMLAFTRQLIEVRRQLRDVLAGTIEARCDETGAAVAMLARSGAQAAILLLNFAEEPRSVTLTDCQGAWRLRVDSAQGLVTTGEEPGGRTTWDSVQHVEIGALRALLFVRE